MKISELPDCGYIMTRTVFRPHEFSWFPWVAGLGDQITLHWLWFAASFETAERYYKKPVEGNSTGQQ